MQNLTSGASLSKAEIKVTWDIAESVVALLSALAEAQDEILEAIVAIEGIKNLLFTIIAHPDSPSSICLDALSALLTLSEDNDRLAKDIVADAAPKPLTALSHLQATADAKGVLACGVLHNIFTTLQWFDATPGQGSLSDAALIPTLSSALKDTTPLAQLSPKSQWSNPAEVTQLALEILADIGTTLQVSLQGDSKKDEEWKGIGDDTAMEEDDAVDTKESDDEDDADEDDDEMDDDDMADMDMVTGADDDDDSQANVDDLPTLRGLIQQAIPELITLATTSSQSEDDLRVQLHALSALNNIAWSISVFDLSDDHNANILKAWAPSGRAIWGKVIVPILAANTADVGLATQVTSLAWAVARSLPRGVPLCGDEHNKFMALYHATKNLPKNVKETNGDKSKDEEPEDPFQGLGVKCIGVLGQLARDPAPIALNREIGVFLITVLTALPETPAADVVEALDQLYDIYGDEDLACDKEVFWKDNFLQHLEGVQAKVKAMVKTVDKRTMPELRTRVDESVLNLGRFVSYKKKHQP